MKKEMPAIFTTRGMSCPTAIDFFLAPVLFNSFFLFLMAIDFEQLAQESALFPWLDDDCMADCMIDSIFADPDFYSEDFLDEISTFCEADSFQDFS